MSKFFFKLSVLIVSILAFVPYTTLNILHGLLTIVAMVLGLVSDKAGEFGFYIADKAEQLNDAFLSKLDSLLGKLQNVLS